MPVFVGKKPMAQIGAVSELATPWRRWFAWYPVSDLNLTFWVCWVEWRRVVPDGLSPDLPTGGRIAARVEYRRI